MEVEEFTFASDGLGKKAKVFGPSLKIWVHVQRDTLWTESTMKKAILLTIAGG